MRLQAECNKGGFVLIELLITLAIIVAVFFTALPLYNRLQTSTQLNESASELAQTVRMAQGRAVSRTNDATHGVYFQSDRYTLFQGSSYASRSTSYDRLVILEPTLTLSNTLSNEITFSKGLGTPSATGSITLTHDAQGTRTVTIDTLGSVQQ